MSTDAFALQHSDLNVFLFADVGVEASGTTLSVLSTLARLGLDPWQEAGRLASLPRVAAAERLARNIVALPASLWSDSDAAAIAARLVALLPKRSSVAAIPAAQLPHAGAVATRLLGLVRPRDDAGRAAPWTNRTWTIVLTALLVLLAGLTLALF